MGRHTTFGDDVRITLDTVVSNVSNLLEPNLRLGVTGLSRAGKTVFITALVHNLLHGGRLPLFEAQANGRLSAAALAHQPDDDVPRFQVEDHVRALVEKTEWPSSTRAISQLRLTLDFESASGWTRRFGASRLAIDIVDYPGEWLLDLPLMGLDYDEWSRDAVHLASLPERAVITERWRDAVADLSSTQEFDEQTAAALAAGYTRYLNDARQDGSALSTLPPGRFLMPGDLEGSPALTFSPLPAEISGPLRETMRRRYEAYKRIVVKPFFREHFARLDRQIVLIDALQALNAGPQAVADLEKAIAGILDCFNAGKRTFLGSLFSIRTDRILFAATKADHLHHSDHDKLEDLLSAMVERASKRARFAGARTDVIAMAAIRATREGTVRDGDDTLNVIVGTPMAGETIDGKSFDGATETAVFPGDLPPDLGAVPEAGSLQFVRFKPPRLERTAEGLALSLPHIRLDRAIQFLLGDRLA